MKNFDRRIPEEVEPENELERQLAVIYCRLNTWKHPLTGAPMSQDEMNWTRTQGYILHARELAGDGANQWMWMKRGPWTNDGKPDSASEGTP